MVAHAWLRYGERDPQRSRQCIKCRPVKGPWRLAQCASERRDIDLAGLDIE
jgi:hypothetical protein